MPAIGDDLGVAAAAEHTAKGLEIAADFGEIIDLAIVGQPDRAVLAGYRLVRRHGEIDDGQSRLRQPGEPIGPHRLVVRPAMLDRAGHCP